MKRGLTAAVLALAICLSLVACGSDKESAQEATQHLCTSLDDFAASVVALQGVGLSSSQDQISSALDNVKQAWNKVVDDAKDVKTANTDAVKSAYEDLKDAVENRPTDKPITDVLAGLEPKLAAFAGAWKQFANSLDCKSSS